MVYKNSFNCYKASIFYSQATDFQLLGRPEISGCHPSLLPMVAQVLLLFQEKNGYQDSS
jgi:hypothetical protein